MENAKAGQIEFDLSFWAYEQLAHPMYPEMMLYVRPVDCEWGAGYRHIGQPGGCRGRAVQWRCRAHSCCIASRRQHSPAPTLAVIKVVCHPPLHAMHPLRPH